MKKMQKYPASKELTQSIEVGECLYKMPDIYTS